jgi:uncharacterized repeat protein (TIGR03803 family)
MKTYNERSFVLSVLIAVFGLVLAGSSTAQTFTTLYNFTAENTNASGIYTNNDGSTPESGLVLSDHTLYGTTWGGGSYGFGTVFRINTDGTGLTRLYDFPTLASTNSSDGVQPVSLVLSGSTLYGRAFSGGSSGEGTLFKLHTDGTGFKNFHSFSQEYFNYTLGTWTNSEGYGTCSFVISSNDTLYGAMSDGGSSGYGTVFKIDTDGTSFTLLHDFTPTSTNSSGSQTNSDGAHPSGLVLSGNTLYGTTTGSGNSGAGTVFKINTDGTGFAILLDVGANALTLSGNTLYCSSRGVFKINTDGTGFTNLLSFDNQLMGTTLLTVDGNSLCVAATFGITGARGGAYEEEVFAANNDGGNLSFLYVWFGDYDFPTGPSGLILRGNTLYGTTELGGSSGNGTIFRISFLPQLTITPSASNIILSWPINYDGFDYTGYSLQSATNLSSPLWTTDLPPPVVVNGQNTVTNAISGTQRFFRLSE